MKPMYTINSNSLSQLILLIVAATLLSNSPLRAADFEIIDQALPNGDFSSGLANWTVEASPSSSAPPGAVTVIDGAARISKGAAFYVGLSQGFPAPDGLVALRLRLTQLPQFGSTGSFIPEAFDVHVTGSNGFSRIASFRPGASATANATAVPAGFNLGSGVTLSGTSLRIPLSDIVEGEWLTFSAALVGASADTQTTVTIDDVVLEVEDYQPVNADYCELFRDSFEDRRGVGIIPRCALGQIGDTGIQSCVGGAAGECPVPGLPGQDAEFGRDAAALLGILKKQGAGPAGFDFTKVDEEGIRLSASANEWACVLDNNLGLMWEVHVDNPLDPLHYENTYSWLLDENESNGGNAGVENGGFCSGSACDTQSKVRAINALSLCGYRNWRLPTRAELSSLVHSGTREPAIAIDYFPWTDGDYWSSTPMAAQPASAWRVQFSDGSWNVELKSTGLKVRLVREIP